VPGEGFAASVIEFAAHGVQVGDFLTKRVHRTILRLRVEGRNHATPGFESRFAYL
jgi:hypothetical protein